MCLVSHGFQQLAHLLPVATQILGNARLQQFKVALRVTAQAALFPQVQQQIHRLGIEPFPAVWQVAPAPSMKACHQRQQQGAFRQFPQPGLAENGLPQQRRPPFGIFWLDPV